MAFSGLKDLFTYMYTYLWLICSSYHSVGASEFDCYCFTGDGASLPPFFASLPEGCYASGAYTLTFGSLFPDFLNFLNYSFRLASFKSIGILSYPSLALIFGVFDTSILTSVTYGT